MIYQEHEITKAAKHLISQATSKTLCLYGVMGVGKTTLTKAIVKELGASGTASSPTYAIVNEYQHKNGSVLGYHFDFYRLNNENEAYDLGFEEYLNQDTWVFIEWPEKISSLLPEKTFDIHIEILDATTRKISF